jgi:hypothetical protein
MENYTNYDKSILQPVSIETKCCTNCKQNTPTQHFIGNKNQILKTCIKCRERDSRRDKTHRNELARICDKKPERKLVKSKWKEQNYEKVATYWMNSRQHKIEELGIEEYLKREAEQSRNWRLNNAEKVIKNNEDKKNNKQLQYNIYSKNAELKNLKFELQYNEFLEIIEQPCYYCNIIQDKGFNGIDRKDQTIGYINNNCVSSCKMCNYIKGSLSDKVFINRVEHILTNNQIINGKLYPECFGNHIAVSYSSYNKRALEKQLEFIITNDEFDMLTANNCYICGKESNSINKNGLDRINNEIGYIIDNIAACCSECNYMKKQYNYAELFDKLQLIYNNHLTNRIVIENKMEPLQNNIIVRTNKKSKEEINKNYILRKQIQREQLKERYSNEEYKQIKAKEIAENRKTKI